MQSRFPVFLIGFVLAGAVITWIVANPKINELLAIESGNRPIRIVGVPMVSGTGGARVTVGLPADEVTTPRLALIHERLNHWRRFGPAERGVEDEVRCSLLALLTEANAATIVRTLPPDDLQTEFGIAALSRWAATDVVAASLWLAQQPERSPNQTWAIAHALANAPVVLEVLCELLPASPWRAALLENTSRASLPDNPANAVLLARRLEPGAIRTKILAGIADEWASRDPVAAAAGSRPSLKFACAMNFFLRLLQPGLQLILPRRSIGRSASDLTPPSNSQSIRSP